MPNQNITLDSCNEQSVDVDYSNEQLFTFTLTQAPEQVIEDVTPFYITEFDDMLRISARLSEFNTAQSKYDARENLEINTIDCGTFN